MRQIVQVGPLASHPRKIGNILLKSGPFRGPQKFSSRTTFGPRDTGSTSLTYTTWIRCKDQQCVVLPEIDFLFKFAIDSLLFSPVEWSYLNTDICKFESPQKDESKAQSADSSKAYRKPRAFIWGIRVTHCNLLASYVSMSSYSEKYLPNIKRQSQLFTVRTVSRY